MSNPAPYDPWRFRASDADREKYLAVLREAYAEGRLTAEEYDQRMTSALSARTYADLATLLHELPVKPGSVPGPPGWTGQSRAAVVPRAPQQGGRPVAVPQAGTHQPQPLGSAATSDSVVLSIFSSNRRDGQWYVPQGQQAVAVMGEVHLDLTSAILPEELTEIRAFALMGSVIVTVPDSVVVDVTGSGFMGEFTRKDKRRKPDRSRVPSPAAPTVRVSGFAMLGSVEIRTVKPKDGLPLLAVVQRELPPPPTRPMVERGPGGSNEHPGAATGPPQASNPEATRGDEGQV